MRNDEPTLVEVCREALAIVRELCVGCRYFASEPDGTWACREIRPCANRQRRRMFATAMNAATSGSGIV